VNKTSPLPISLGRLAFTQAARPFPLAMLAALLLAHAALLAPLPLGWQAPAALALLALIPGALLAEVLLPSDRETAELVGMGVALGVAFAALLTLAAQALPGPLSAALVLAPADALSAALLVALLKRKTQNVERRTEDGVRRNARSTNALALRSALYALCFLAAAIRLPNLGHSEFQGDEARAALLASEVVRGAEGVLLLHQKGPVEALLPSALFALLGRQSEWSARLPFAAANLGALLLIYAVGRHLLTRLLPGRAGEWAALGALALLAVNGYMVAFARIVQYQSVVLLCGAAVLWCALRCYEILLEAGSGERGAGSGERGAGSGERGAGSGERGAAAHCVLVLLVAAAVGAAGALAHYEGALVLPAAGLLVLAGGRRGGLRPAALARMLLPPALLFAGLLACFYAPFVLGASFADTGRYLAGRVASPEGSGLLYNNLRFYVLLSSFYSSFPQVLALELALLGGLLCWLWQYVRPRALAVGLGALLAAGVALSLLAPILLVAVEANWALLLFAPALAALLLARATPLPLRVALLWWAPPFLLATFVVRKPGTHFYTGEPAAALLACYAAAQLVLVTRRPLLRRTLVGAGAALVAFGAAYVAMVYTRVQPEYKRVFPQARPAIFAAPYGDRLPDGGYFGFPYQAGWKAVGYLQARGLLGGTYDTNEEDLVTGWYMRGAPRCYWRPQYYLVAERVQDPHQIPLDEIERDYRRVSTITVGGEPKIAVYARPDTRPTRMLAPPELASAGAAAVLRGLPPTLAAESLALAFDELAAPGFAAGQPLAFGLLQPAPQHRLDAPFPVGARLLGYDLYTAPSSGARFLTLFWRPLGPLPAGTQVDVLPSAADGARLAAAPAPCGALAPDQWRADEYVSAVYEITAPNATSATVSLAGASVTVPLP
jgi:4-amino-4-deoxy-L-arabinose transferase-like glycosyltransferase